ncbi:MAG: HAMP domain-containing sensor histidine kinase [Oceanicoccus sp.]
MKFIFSLYGKLTLAMLILFVALGAALVVINAKTSEMYSLEITQRINRDIALHAAEDMPLLQQGVVNEQALKELAHHVMFINPIVEVYLLDTAGNILSHALPSGSVLLEKVDLAPLQLFLQDQKTLPIFGDDPRNPDRKKVFSVSPIKENDIVKAYLYTVLNGKDHDNLRQSLESSYNLRVGAITIAGSVLLAALAGLLIFSLLTRRLQALSHTVALYRKNSFQGSVANVSEATLPDEIDELSQAIIGMSQRIENQFSALQDADNSRRELITNISHDLRTPLASMQGYLETILIKAGDLSEEDKVHYLETAYKHSKRLNQLISELFELSKLESANVEPDWEQFLLMELIHDLVQDYELQAREENVSLSVHCEDMSITVYADIALIHRVLENLLKNALQHSHNGGNIDLNVYGDEHKIWLEVVDNGVGIASHVIPHIFERFYRPDTEKIDSGNGLGLAIVKRILELHRSQVAVRSELDKETVFSFWLPASATC